MQKAKTKPAKTPFLILSFHAPAMSAYSSNSPAAPHIRISRIGLMWYVC